MTASLAISLEERFSISTSTANNRFDSSRLLTAICISLLSSSNAIVFPGNCVNHHEFLCPDRLPYAVCRKHITGNEVPFSCYPFNRCMPHYLQKLPWFIKPPFVILRPVPDRRRSRLPTRSVLLLRRVVHWTTAPCHISPHANPLIVSTTASMSLYLPTGTYRRTKSSAKPP